MRRSTKSLLASAAMAGSLISGSALAEPFGLLNGRVANMANMSDMSVEVGAIFGEVSDIDYEHFGARVNYRLSPVTFLYGDLGMTDLDSRVDGLAFGVGAFHQMDGIVDGADFALHFSYHRASLEGDGFDFDRNAITLEALFSGKEPMGASDNMFWNANLGLNRASGDGDTDTELMFGGGVVVRNASGSGEFYVGALYVDDLGFGGGYRHFLD